MVMRFMRGLMLFLLLVVMMSVMIYEYRFKIMTIIMIYISETNYANSFTLLLGFYFVKTSSMS